MAIIVKKSYIAVQGFEYLWVVDNDLLETILFMEKFENLRILSRQNEELQTKVRRGFRNTLSSWEKKMLFLFILPNSKKSSR